MFGLLGVILAMVLLALSFFILVVISKVDSNPLKVFGKVIAVLLWVCVVVVILINLRGGHLGEMDMNWNFIFNAITAVTAFITACAIIIAVWQLRFTAWLKAQEIFTDDDFRKARGVVLAHYWQSGKKWTNDDKKKAALVCAKMDELARLIPFISEKKILETWDDPMGKCWYVLEDFVIKERKTTKWDVKWKAFEEIGRKSFYRVKERK